jgi:hypothetical protein
MTGPYPQPGQWGPPPPPIPPRKSQTGAIIGTVFGVVLMLGLGAWAVIGIISSRHSAAASSTTTSSHPTTTRPPRTSTTNSTSYHVNDCVWLDVTSSERVSCTSDKAALQINLVIPKSTQCVGDFDSFGDHWYDDDTSLRYCASLAVPKGQCLKADLSDTGVVERAPCSPATAGVSGAPHAKLYQVIDVVSGTDGKTVCDKVPGTDDTWFYQSNFSGQFACLKLLAG